MSRSRKGHDFKFYQWRPTWYAPVNAHTGALHGPSLATTAREAWSLLSSARSTTDRGTLRRQGWRVKRLKIELTKPL